MSSDWWTVAGGLSIMAAVALLMLYRYHAAQASDRRLRALADALPVMLAYVDRNERYIFVNRAIAMAYGTEPDKVLGKTAHEMLGSEAYLKAKPYIRRALNGERVSYLREERRLNGTRWFQATYSPHFAPDGKTVLGFHGMLHEVTAEKLQERQLRALAHLDTLTGLSNRAGLEQYLARALSAQRVQHTLTAVMILDLDRFKSINDTHGHLVGDAVLRMAAVRLRASLRSGDLIARLGGDEFVVVMDRLAKPEDAQRVADKILDAMRAPFVLEQGTLEVTASIGLAYYRGGETTVDSLIKQADDLMYRAKQAGRDTCCSADLAIDS